MNFRRTAVISLVLSGGGAFVLTFLPGVQTGVADWDKVEHLVAYGLLGLLVSLAANSLRQGIVLAAGLLGLGVGTELLQAFVPGRNVDAEDAIANLVGAAAGLLVGLALVAAIQRLRSATPSAVPD
jgi:VanZ family protein